MTTPRKTPTLSVVPPPAAPAPDPFSVPLNGVWLSRPQGFAEGTASVMPRRRFSTQLGAEGVVVGLDLNPATGAVRVTMDQGGRRRVAYLGAAAVLLSEAT